MEEFVMRLIEQAPTIGILLFLLVRKDAREEKLLDSCLNPCSRCQERQKKGLTDSP